MAISAICFLVRTPLTKRDYDRFGIELIRSKGYGAYVLDLTQLLNPQYLKNYTPHNLINDKHLSVIKSKNELLNFFKEKGGTIFVVDWMGADYSNLFIYRYLKKYGVTFASFCANALPLPKPAKEKPLFVKIMAKLTKMFSKDFFKKEMKILSIKLFRYVCEILQYIGQIKAPDYVLAGGREMVYAYPLPNATTKIIYGHTLDYDIILQEKIVPRENGYAVFIDEYVPYHPDFIISKHENIDAEAYYGGLNRFFDWFEHQFKQEVVIAAHPRSRYDQKPQCYGARKIIKGKTAETIAGASCVLTHESTAISFAVCFKKPLFFLTCDEFEKTFHGPGQELSAGKFGLKPINVDRPFDDLKLDFTYNNDLYARYFDDYIKTPDSPQKLFWEIVVDELRAIKK